MKISTITLWVYAVSVVLVLIAYIFDNELLKILFKPILIPSIFYYYYLIKKTEAVNKVLITALMLNFITDMVFLIELDYEIYYAIFLLFLNNLIFIYLSIDQLKTIKYNFKSVLYAFLILIFFIAILGLISELIFTTNILLNIFYTVYGFVLVILSTIIGYNYFNEKSLKNLFGLIMCGCFIFSDSFFAISIKFPEFKLFEFINIFFQSISYYYIVRYANSKLNLIY